MSDSMQYVISAICPVFNEEKHLAHLVEFFLNALPVEKEIFFIDGGSTDRTRTMLTQYEQEFPGIIRWLNNSNKYVPFALNMAIPRCQGKYIICLGAHTRYADDYFVKIIQTFEQTGADIVGGPTRAEGDTILQRAIAKAISCSFGTGGSKIHDETFRGFTDHVTFGAWRKGLFEEVGFFDEELIRDQDDEFHYRARSKGKTLFLNPDIKLFYHPRASFWSLFKQYFQYGYYKPIVSIKVKTEIKARHLIPFFFVTYLLFAVIGVWWYPIAAVPLILYLLVLFVQSVRQASEAADFGLLLLIFPLIHIGYGAGYLTGLPKVVWRLLFSRM